MRVECRWNQKSHHENLEGGSRFHNIIIRSDFFSFVNFRVHPITPLDTRSTMNIPVKIFLILKFETVTPLLENTESHYPMEEYKLYRILPTKMVTMPTLSTREKSFYTNPPPCLFLQHLPLPPCLPPNMLLLYHPPLCLLPQLHCHIMHLQPKLRVSKIIICNPNQNQNSKYCT